jgi:hypothetical protein
MSARLAAALAYADHGPDLFGVRPIPPIGLTVRLTGASNDRRHDRCGNLAIVEKGKAMHAGSLRCLACGGFRRWLSHLEFNWLAAVAAKRGVSNGPITLRDYTTGDHTMTPKAYDNTNRGALFRTEKEKENETDRDYSGSLNVNGTEFWISGWIKTSAKGTKYLSLAIKQKDAAKETNKPEFNDSIGF